MYFLLPSWYPFHVANDFQFWYFQGSCQELGKKKNMDLVGSAGRNIVCWRETSNRGGSQVESIMFKVWQYSEVWRLLSKSRIDKKRMPQTCWGGSVALCGLAGRTPSYSVNSWHTETIVDMAVELEKSWIVIPRHSQQLLPVSWLPLAFFILDNKLCRQAER